MVRALAEIAYDAGNIILRHYVEEIVSRKKDDASPVLQTFVAQAEA